jgi:hypothetical protein
MKHWAIGRLTVIALTGIFVFAAVPAFAACIGDKCTEGGSTISKRQYKKDQVKVDAKSNALPSDVADARAQMSSDDVKSKPAAEASAQLTAEAATPATQDAAVQLVNADELNDLDKAATDVTAPLPKLPPSIANSRAEMRFEGPSTWTQTSTVGKAFIAFGVMLTLASAARMFMA